MTSLSTHEQTVNVALGEVLRGMRRSWNVVADRRGKVLREGGYPDVLVLDAAGWPVVIEAKHHPHYAWAEDAAEDRLGSTPVGGEHAIETAIALVYPPEFQQLDGEALRDAIRTTDALEYALHTDVRDDKRGRERLPESGWLRGSVIDLAMLVHRAATPARRVEKLADALAEGVDRAAELFAFPYGGERGAALAGVLGQTDDMGGQTRRMAMTVLLNALVFHAALAQVSFTVRGAEGERAVRPVEHFWERSAFRHRELLDEWDAILERNYWPIFASAREMLGPAVMTTETAAKIARRLWYTASDLIQRGVTRSHDLTGTVFQRLIADRKFLATFYTRPEAAAMLAGLALPADRPPGGADWADAETLAGVQIGDFACGTGTLLAAAYSRLSLLHELHGGNARALHGPMMAHGLYGLDVLNIAVHLTAAMLAGAHPDTPFDGECLLTMPYGARDDGNAAIGSLDLLAAEVQPGLIGEAAATTAGGRSPEDVRDLVNRVGHGRFDLVIMNPPFTRPTNHEASHADVPIPAYAAFETNATEQRTMSANVKALTQGAPSNDYAGLASHFAELAQRKVRPAGTVAMVLPLSALSGGSWGAVRRQWADACDELVAVTVAAASDLDSSFSADTGMAECLFIGSKKRPGLAIKSPSRAVFANLRKRPSSALRGDLIASAIRHAMDHGAIRRLEDGPVSGTPILLGDEYCGHLLDCPLPEDGPWPVVGIADAALAQVAYQIAEGHLPPLASESSPHDLPITRLGAFANSGPVHRLIGSPTSQARGAFRIRMPASTPVPHHPVLWAHDTKRERRLLVEPDSEGIPIDLEDAQRIQSTATRAHYNSDLRFNSQSLIVAMTERPCIGGRAWPSIIFENPDHEYAFALWSNSTLGLLLHWWSTNKTQSGRGSTTVTGIPRIPTLDVRELSAEQHARARAAFESLRNERFLPFDQIFDEDGNGSDPARAELDRALLVDVLGLPESLCADGGPLETLRRKLAAEPQIHGGKRTRVVFTDTGERTERRADR